eukprot:scaffold6847_cov71-Cylindrotheca_fusiformis.AAC.3
MTEKVGSPRYMAPEVSSGRPYNLKADVYSFGLLVYQMMTGKTPYKGIEMDWMSSSSVVNKHFPKSWSKELRQLLSNCQSSNLTKRPTMNQCLTELKLTLDNKNQKNQEEEEENDGSAFDLAMCGVSLPSYEDFEELLGCATGGVGPQQEEEEEDTYEEQQQEH